MRNRFFPGGIAEFTAKKNEFLGFEKGPSTDVTLQWATYHDAAAQTCLSRLKAWEPRIIEKWYGRKGG